MVTTAQTDAGREAKVVWLVCMAHFVSHFHFLLLPPLFPLLRDFYGVGFTELGLTLTVVGIAGTVAQVPFGFLVDRFGARAILVVAILVESIAIAMIGVFPLYGALIALMAAAGLANAIFHPADYAILNASVGRQSVGRAFAYHTFSGNIGDALAPMAMLAITAAVGWRAAIFACGAFGVMIGLLVCANYRMLGNVLPLQHTADGQRDAVVTQRSSGVALLLTAPIVMGMLFYVGIAMTGGGIYGFSVAALHGLYQTPLGAASFVLTAYLLGAPLGVLAGGFAIARISRHDHAAAACFVCVALAIFAIVMFEPPVPVMSLLFAFAGFCTGFVAPQRDMMIRAITPPRDTGKVFAFVSTGFSVGGTIAPVCYGWLLDHTSPANIFWASGVLAVLTAATAILAGLQQRPGAQRQYEAGGIR